VEEEGSPLHRIVAVPLYRLNAATLYHAKEEPRPAILRRAFMLHIVLKRDFRPLLACLQHSAITYKGMTRNGLNRP